MKLENILDLDSKLRFNVIEGSNPSTCIDWKFLERIRLNFLWVLHKELIKN